MHIKIKKIVVTGGLGSMDLHTVVELQNAGFEAVIINNLSNAQENVLGHITRIADKKPLFEKFNLRDKVDVQDLSRRHIDVKGLIHFAASKAVGESVERPLLYYNNNLTSLIYLLGELSKLKKAHFTFNSSCTVYGQADKLPITEDAPIKKVESPYGNIEQISEEVISDTCRVAPQLSAVALRYFSPIGAHPSAKIDELPLGVPQNLMPYITQIAIGLREKLSVSDDGYPTPNGICIRDYMHVVYLVEAHVIALQRLLNDENAENCGVFNIGTDKGSSALEIIQNFERVSGKRLDCQIAARRAGDVTAACASADRTDHVLGWEAKSTLDSAMLSTWKWEQKVRSK